MTKAAIALLGIDLGKNSCSAAGLDAGGTIVFRCLARAHTPPAFNRRQDEASWDRQTRQRLPTNAAHPWCPRGDSPLRKQDSPTAAWLRQLLSRAHPDVAVVALAAKLARIAWATLRSGQAYRPLPG